MKVQRYNYGASNVQQRQAGRAALRTPEQAGAEAYAPYGAVADVAGAITQGLQKEDQRRKKIQDDEDRITLKLMEVKAKAGINRIKTDPQYDNQLQEDGSSTGLAILEDFEEHSKNQRAMLDEIQNPRIRDAATRILEVNEGAFRADMRSHVNDKSEAWNAMAQIDLFQVAIEGQDWAFANEQLDYMRDNKIITPAKYIELGKRVNNERLDADSDDILSDFNATPPGQRDDFYNRLVNDKTLDEDLKRISVAKVENQLINFERIQKKQTSLAKAELIENKTDMLVALKTNQPMPMSIDELMAKADAVGDPALSNTARGWRQEILFAGISGIKDDSKYQEFQANRRSGIFLDNDVANQKNLQREINDGIVEGMSENQMKQRAIDIQRDAGFLSFSAEQMFSTAKRDANYLAGIAPLWGELMLNPDIDRSMDTDVEPENQRLLTDTYRAMEAGVPPLEAALGSIETSEKWEQDKEIMQARQTFYTTKNTGKDAAEDGFETLVDKIYDTTRIPFRGQGEFVIEGLGRDAQARYDNYFHTTFMQTNDLESARLQADLQFMQNHNMNNLNGDWNIELNGVKGDVNYIRKDYVKNNSSEVVLFVGDEGLTGSTLGDLDDVQFRNPEKVKNGRKYEVWNGSSPVMQDIERTVDKKKVVSREQVFKTVDTSEQNAKELKEIRETTADEITDLEKEYDAATKHLETTNPYFRDTSAKSVRNVEGKIRLAKEKLAKEEARLSPEF
jgi:hypothetical protein